VDVPRYALIFALLALVACTKTKSIAPDPSDRPRKDAAPPNDEVAIWSIVVDDVAAPFADAGMMPVVDETSSVPCMVDLAQAIPTAKRETIDAFVRAGPTQKLPPLSTRVAMRFVGEDVPVGSPPPGFLALSAVAFDGAHRDALVSATHVLGPKSMRIVAYHLVRDGDAWRKMEIARCN